MVIYFCFIFSNVFKDDLEAIVEKRTKLSKDAFSTVSSPASLILKNFQFFGTLEKIY